MKASLFCTARYMGTAPHDIWPLSGEYYSGEAAVRSMQTTFGGPTSNEPPERTVRGCDLVEGGFTAPGSLRI